MTKDRLHTNQKRRVISWRSEHMIHVTRINHQKVMLNSDLIEQIESTPDTVITLTNGQKLVVRDSEDEIVDRVIAFRRAILAGPGSSRSGSSSQILEDHIHGNR
jgi:flagellar protein FlbD